jgi:hypothetical protein
MRATAFTFETCHQPFQLGVVVDSLDQRPELPVAAHRDVDPHPLDRLGRGEAGLLLGLGGHRLVDQLSGLRVDVHDLAVDFAVDRHQEKCTSAE